MSFDRTDLAILRELRDDGRLSVAQLAERLNMSRGATYQRLGRLQSAGVLRGFTAVVDEQQLDRGMTAVLLLSAGRDEMIDWPALRDRFAAMPQVVYVAFVTGQADILVTVRVSDKEALRAFVFDEVRALPGVSSTLTLVVLDDITPRPFVLPDTDSTPRGS